MMRVLAVACLRSVLVAVLLFTCSCTERPRLAPGGPAFTHWADEEIRWLLEREVTHGNIAGAVGLVLLEGTPVFFESVGSQDEKSPMRKDTLFRIASMTKPVTSVAIMILNEEGKLALDDPISAHIPAFAEPQVAVGSARAPGSYELIPAEREITIHDLLTHTAGLSYRFMGKEPLATIYAAEGISDGLAETPGTIGEGVQRLAAAPLLHQPGAAWEYGLSTDVLGHLVELVSGKPLDHFFQERIFDPLGMEDTHFFLPPDELWRLAALYTPDRDGLRPLGDGPVTRGHAVYSASSHYDGPRTYLSGGAGLVSTASDYGRFCRMLLRRGELDGVRVLRPESVDLMTRNQIGDLQITWKIHGDGFGYGFGVLSDELAATRPESAGTYSWGGFFYTDFWVDPELELIGILMTQLRPHPLSLDVDFRDAVYRVLEVFRRSGGTSD